MASIYTTFLQALALGVFLTSAVASARILETKSIAEVEAELTPDTLLIFDLDNTIIMPAQTLGGEEWFDYLVEKYVAKAVSAGTKPDTAKLLALRQALEEWNAVQEVTQSIPVEKNAPAVVAEAQRSGVKTMALTARPPELKKKTFEQLQAAGFALHANAHHREAFDLKGAMPTRHENSVVFVNAGNNKGDILVQYLQTTGNLPKKIVFVDNKLKHVEAVQKALQQAAVKVDYVGCRHGATDAKIAAFDKNIADTQHRYFGKILDDAAAKKLLAP